MNVKEYKNRVAALGCLICGAPAELHHPRFACGMSQRANDFLVIGLCPAHHRQGAFGHCVHNGYQEFCKNYMSEEDMLAETIKRMMK